MFDSGNAFVVVLIFWLLGLYAFYWIIRLAVRHGMNDHVQGRGRR